MSTISKREAIASTVFSATSTPSTQGSAIKNIILSSPTLILRREVSPLFIGAKKHSLRNEVFQHISVIEELSKTQYLKQLVKKVL